MDAGICRRQRFENLEGIVYAPVVDEQDFAFIGERRDDRVEPLVQRAKVRALVANRDHDADALRLERSLHGREVAASSFVSQPAMEAVR